MDTVFDIKRIFEPSSVRNIQYGFELNRIDDDKSAPLKMGHNKVIDNLLSMGHEIRSITSTYCYRKPVGITSPFPRFEIKWTDYAIFFKQGFFRFALLEDKTAYITLFYLHPEHQCRGLGARHFRKISDNLEAAGIETQFGEVFPPANLKSVNGMSVKRLREFYLKSTPFTDGGNGWIVRQKVKAGIRFDS